MTATDARPMTAAQEERILDLAMEIEREVAGPFTYDQAEAVIADMEARKAELIEDGVLDAEDAPDDLCGMCGMRRARRGFTACTTCA